MTTIFDMPKPVMPIWRAQLRWSAREARAALAALDASGLSIATFAKREGLVPERLYNWRRKLGESVAPTADFVEVRAKTSGRVEVLFPSGVTLRAAETIEPAVLARLVAALGSGC